jgi:hypothetical protein
MVPWVARFAMKGFGGRSARWGNVNCRGAGYEKILTTFRYTVAYQVIEHNLWLLKPSLVVCSNF